MRVAMTCVEMCGAASIGDASVVVDLERPWEQQLCAPFLWECLVGNRGKYMFSQLRMAALAGFRLVHTNDHPINPST